MNEKEFKFILKNWKTVFNTTAHQKEALTTFLKRGLSANNRKETCIKKIHDKKIYNNARSVLFIEKISGVKYQLIIDYKYKKVNLFY